MTANKRPQNCGTGHCSCIECVVEPAQRPIKTYHGGKPWPVAPKVGCVNHDCDQCKAQQELVAAIQEVIGCFDAAFAEGLQEALANTTDERLKDLVERRLMHALYAAQNTTPQSQPAREWVGLTDEWIESAGGRWVRDGHDLYGFARAAEAKLKEKNSGAQPAREPIKWSDYEPDGTHHKRLEEKIKDAFYEGFTSVETYNDKVLNDVDEAWLKYAAAHGITKGQP